MTRRDLVWIFFLMVVAGFCVYWNALTRSQVVARVQACELAHFGDDSEAIVARIDAALSAMKNPEVMQRYVDAAFNDIVRPLVARVQVLESNNQLNQNDDPQKLAVFSELLAKNIALHLKRLSESSDEPPSDEDAERLIASIVHETLAAQSP